MLRSPNARQVSATDVVGVAGLADVGGDEAGVPERAGGSLAGGGVDIGDGDAPALGDVAAGDRQPDAVRGAGDDRDLVLEPHAGLRLSVNGSTRTATVVPAHSAS
jgi:hypothetical protein